MVMAVYVQIKGMEQYEAFIPSVLKVLLQEILS